MKFKPGHKVIYRSMIYGQLTLLELTLTRVWSMHRVLETPTFKFKGIVTKIIKEGQYQKFYLRYEIEGYQFSLSFNTEPDILMKELL